MIPPVRQDSAWSPAIHNTEIQLLPLRDPRPRGAPSAGSNNPRPSVSALPSAPPCAPVHSRGPCPQRSHGKSCGFCKTLPVSTQP